jgi:hypothetical protein
MNALAVLIELRGIAALLIGKIVKMDLYARFTQGLYPVEHINGSPVIGGPWGI